MEPSIYFPCVRRTSIKFCQLFMCPWELKKVPHGYWIFCQLQSTSVWPQDLPSNFRASAGLSVNFPHVRSTFCELPSTFCASEGPSINFSCISVTFCQLKSIFRASSGDSVNLSYSSGTFHQLLSTFRAYVGHSVILPCVRRIVRQLFVRARDLM